VTDQRRGNPLRPEERELELQQRLLTRERRRVVGLLIIALIILAIAFLRFGKTIPWGAR
jgi:hypothetical protein